MPRLSRELVYTALEKAAAHLYSTTAADQPAGRREIRSRIRTLEGAEKSLTEALYRFADQLAGQPAGGLTTQHIARALDWARRELVDAYDLDHNGLSEDEIERMSPAGRQAVAFARSLKLQAVSGNILSVEDLQHTLRDLGEGLYFPAWANESDAELQFFFREASLARLTEEQFADILELDPSLPAEEVSVFQQGLPQYAWIFDNYERDGDPAALSRFVRLHAVMRSYLRDLTHIVVGRDGSREDGRYPVYFVGITQEGDLAGFTTFTIWT